MKNAIIASTSTTHNSGYLEYILPHLEALFDGVSRVIFIPYARPSGITHDEYTKTVSNAFQKIGKSIKGIHEYEDAKKAVTDAEGIFVGGGNTFVLVNELYKNQLLEPLRKAIFSGTPYLGTSAGSNICGLTIGTSNDMPIVYPPSFKTMGIVPFNINPHYLDPNPDSTHMGETRETRIKEFHKFNNQPVIGLREGSWLRVKGNDITLEGPHEARVFEQHKTPYEISSNTTVSHLK